MNYPAASSGGDIECSDEVLQSLAVGPFRSVFAPSGRLRRQVNGPRTLPAPTRISPASTTKQKQHYDNDQYSFHSLSFI